MPRKVNIYIIYVWKREQRLVLDFVGIDFNKNIQS